MNETKELLSKTYNLSYDPEMGVVFHWSRHRGWVPLSRRTTNKGAFYVFKHEGRATYVNEKVIIEAFAETPRKYYVMDRCNTYSLEDMCKTAWLYEETEHEEDN